MCFVETGAWAWYPRWKPFGSVAHSTRKSEARSSCHWRRELWSGESYSVDLHFSCNTKFRDLEVRLCVCVCVVSYEGVSKSFRTGRLEPELQMVQLSATRCSSIAILWVSFCRHKPSCCFSTSVYCCKHIFRYRLSPETFGYTVVFRTVFTQAQHAS
jgi:hypothetical protein